MQNHEGGLHHHLRQRAVFCLQLSAAIPATYIDCRDQGVTILSARRWRQARRIWLAVTGIIVAVVAMSKLFLGTYFGVIEGASEIVKSSLGLLGVRKSRAFNRDVDPAGLRLHFCGVLYQPECDLNDLRYQRTAYRHDLVYHAHAVDMAHSGAEAVPLGG